MNVTCPECSSVFRIDPGKVPVGGVQARCSVCGGVIAVAAPTAAAPRGPAAPAGPGAPASGDASRADLPEPVAAPAVAVAPDSNESDSAPAPSSALTHAVRPEVPEAAAVPPPVRDAVPEPAPVPRAARPVNPYLNNTPELRARRLARALVSDLVAYNPQKREQGLRDGTLRQLFRDEIRKSWDEYVEQVGANVAESTPHFQDALNDVLAGGRRVF